MKIRLQTKPGLVGEREREREKKTSHKTTVVVSTMHALYSRLIAGDSELRVQFRLVVLSVGGSRCLAAVRHDASQYEIAPFTIGLTSTMRDLTYTKNANMHYMYDRGHVVKASDRGWPCHEFEPSTTKDSPCRVAMHVKSVESSSVLPLLCCQVIYSQFGLAIHPNDHQARRRFVEWAQNEIAVVPDFHKRILFSDEAHFWLNGYVNKQNCRIWSEANPQVCVETPLHPEKLTVWCALWAGGILLQKR
ncbi:uncharacterized protein TNCV_2035541 [Trichonephila clavipes]|nr:uncharacterized protein TNCV_2035541 [Trichonephila clavipes]